MFPGKLFEYSDYLCNSIYYGFPIVTIILIIFKSRINLFGLSTDSLIKWNNLATLLRSVIKLLLILVAFAFAIGSKDEFESYAFINRMTGPQALFFWLIVVLEFSAPFLFLRKKYQVSLNLSLVVIILWSLSVFAGGLSSENFQNITTWHKAVYPNKNFVILLLPASVYIACLSTFVYILSRIKKSSGA